jgi:hypothetical protein
VYLEHMREREFGRIGEQQSKGMFEYHYYHYMRCALLQ